MSLNKYGIHSLQSLDSIKLVSFNPKIQCKIENLGYHSIKQLEVLSKKRWEEYYKKGGNIYLQKYTTKLPFSKRIVFDKIALKYLKKGTPKPQKPKKVKRGYVKGSLCGKANGLNLYIQKNDKLTKKDRAKLLLKSENYISVINEGLSNSQKHSHLDPSLTDLENIDIWNEFFQKFGNYFTDLRNRWEGIYLNDKSETNSIINNEENPNIKLPYTKKSKYVDWGV
jgi:hypothetical protein